MDIVDERSNITIRNLGLEGCCVNSSSEELEQAPSEKYILSIQAIAKYLT